MYRRALLCTAALALTMSVAGANAAHLVWSGLVIAQNTEKPKPVAPELARLEETLKELFGYNQFEVIGQSRKTLKTGQEDWMAQSKYFSLHVDAQGADDAGYELNLQLFQEKELLLQTNTKLSERSPLVIKGPQVGGGQLLLVLMVDDDALKNQAGENHRHSNHSNKMVTAWRHFSRMIRGSP
ncbi:MAG: hypothetical protein QOG67_1622 [Verrucomicrobiota bacterium]|jgi:hypothetical protein